MSSATSKVSEEISTTKRVGSEVRKIVSAYVDWNCQLLSVQRRDGEDPVRTATKAFHQVTKRLAIFLNKEFPAKNWKVKLAFYHGWHKGYEPTSNRRALAKIISETDFAALSYKPNVIFFPEIRYGDYLASALQRRLHARLAIHLPNTLRSRRNSEWEEKMVDTALASDVVAAAHTDPNDWIIVMAEDDDLVPCVFTAEAALQNGEGRILILRKRKDYAMLQLDDLLFEG